jgi:hypothetical protein
VRLPFCARPVALPVLAWLVVKGTNSASRRWLARRMTQDGPACAANAETVRAAVT